MNTIRKGTSLKDSVILLQDFLASAAYEIVVDGDFGPKTINMMRSWSELMRSLNKKMVKEPQIVALN